jgi:predicted ester cyclase
MSLEKNKAVVRKGIEAFNKRNLVMMDELTAPDYIDHTHRYRGQEANKQFLTMHIKGFADFCMAIEDMIAEGDNV